MVKLYFHTNYPDYLAKAISSLHALQTPMELEIHRQSKVEGFSFDHAVVFLFDHAKRNIDPVTQAMFDSGYRVFALKLTSTEKLDNFKLGLTVIGLWSKVLDKINNEKDPFIFTYKYSGTNLKREK